MSNSSTFNQSLCYIPFFCFVPILSSIPTFASTQQAQVNLKSENQHQIFMLKFMEKLKDKHSTCYVKEWSEEEDQRLIKYGVTCKNWKKFSKQFQGKSAKVCQRRYRKLIRKEKLWPKQDQDMIRHLKEVENKSWIEIEMFLKQSDSDYTAKQIRQRYKNHLSPEISRDKWTIEQDLELWNKVSQIGKCWREVAKQLPTRSGLQIRNRYYKFILPLCEEAKRQLKSYNC